MALQDASPGASLASARSSLSRQMPWEWVLETLLDVQELSLPFLNEVISYIPQIEEPRCSRLLQKVALRLLDEVVVTRRINACDVPLIRFLLKEQGVSNLRRIRSLKESFEYDLILRIETEAVLATLRYDSKEGGREWEAFEDAVDSVFPADTSEPRCVDRRKELVAVLADLSRGEPEQDLCEQLLGKYSLEELLRDIEHFVEDKRKLFKIKFLDQLAKDVDNGLCHTSSTNISSLQEAPIPPEVQIDCSGKHTVVPDGISAGGERLMQNQNDASSMAETNSVVPGVSHDVTDPALDLLHATCVPGSTSTSRKNYERVSTHGDKDSDTQPGVLRGNVPLEEDLRTEMSFGMAEVDKVAMGLKNEGLTNEINELLNDVTKFRVAMHNATGVPASTPCLSNRQSSNHEGTSARDPVLIQQNSEVGFNVQRAEVDRDVDKPGGDAMESGKQATDSESPKGCRVGGTSPTDIFASIDKVLKRVPDRTVDQVTGVAEKGKQGVEEESESQKGQRKQSNANDNAGLRCSPIVIETGEGLSKGRLSRESEDTASPMVDGNSNMIDRKRGTCRKRIDLHRLSKKRQASPKTVGAASAELRVPVAEDEDPKLNGTCSLCGKSGGRQLFCHECPVSLRECCVQKLCMTPAGVENRWYCLSCAATMAQDAVKKAKEDLRKAKEALKKAEEEALKTQKRLAAFLSATGAPNGLFEHNKGNHPSNLLRTTTESSSPVQAEQDSTEDSKSEPEREEIAMEPGVSISGPVLQEDVQQDSMMHASPTRKDFKMQTPLHPSIPNKELDAAKSTSVRGTMSSREAIDRQGSPSVPSLPVTRGTPLADEQTFGSGAKELSGASDCPKDRLPPMASDANDSQNRFGAHEGATEDVETNRVAAGGVDVLMSPVGGSNCGNDPNNPDCGGDGDGHDGDLEEVCEGNKANPTGTEGAEEADGATPDDIPDVPTVKVKPKWRQVYRGRRQIPGFRRKNLPWTEIEENVLKEGVKMFSHAGEWGFQWTRILEFGEGKFHKSRTTVDLKDKWRNLTKGGGIFTR